MIPYIFVDDDDDDNSLGNGNGATSSVSTSSSSPSCLLAKDSGSTPHMFLSYAKALPLQNEASTAAPKASFSTAEQQQQQKQQRSDPIGSHIIFNSTPLLSSFDSETLSSVVDLEEADQDGTFFLASNTKTGQDTGEASPQLSRKMTKTIYAHCIVDGATNTDCQESFLKDLQLNEGKSKHVMETLGVATAAPHEDDENINMMEGLSLEQQCARQKYEIAFLRAVVRELLVRNQVLSDKKNKIETKKVNATQNPTAIDKMGGALATTTDQELPDNGIPKQIEFHTEEAPVENNSLPMGTPSAAMQRLSLEETSQLTPSLNDYDHLDGQPFNLRPTSDLSTDDLLQDMGKSPHTEVYWDPSTALNLESSQALTVTTQPPSQQAVVPVQHSKTKDGAIHVSPPSPILPTPSYPDMKTGEVLHHLARGIDLILYILKNDENAKDFVKGRYTGRICEKSGLPQGHGVFRFERNGGFYAGSFHDGKLHGQGTLLVQDNHKWTKLRGTFQRNDFVGPIVISTVQKQPSVLQTGEI